MLITIHGKPESVTIGIADDKNRIGIGTGSGIMFVDATDFAFAALAVLGHRFKIALLLQLAESMRDKVH